MDAKVHPTQLLLLIHHPEDTKALSPLKLLKLPEIYEKSGVEPGKGLDLWPGR